MNPFAVETDHPLVAICGLRNGYIQLSCREDATHYEALPEAVLMAAKAWAARLESMGAERVYWITLSEVVRQLHIHLYPRWPEDSEKGLDLFARREAQPQPVWTPETTQKLQAWSQEFQVYLIQ